MSGTDWAAIITATGVLLGILGRGVAWLVKLVQDQSDRTITALKEENAALKEQLARCAREHGT
jgi:hypothetical protein